MDEKFIQQRIRQLRELRRLPAKRMSLALGQNEAYISHIETGTGLPAMPAFLSICEHLHVTPQEFFREGKGDPLLQNALMADIIKLDEEDLELVATVVKKLLSK